MREKIEPAKLENEVAAKEPLPDRVPIPVGYSIKRHQLTGKFIATPDRALKPSSTNRARGQKPGRR